jgi:hypothetical protein
MGLAQRSEPAERTRGLTSVDIRDNTAESWRRGMDYLLRRHLLDEP